ncbi:MAG: DUF3987 domain-containing protein [Candidatus Andersenbacteria bacterium]|nr:DUF3987 domain-containing protein [Candidatus Andersenbacteria bacterium]MBI3251188.1 DUF3987 domain-containing protein [Candidatus Andersenbacteria bacterium]
MKNDSPQWEPITPFDEYQLPPFPLHTLPLDLQEWVAAEAVNTQTPIDLPALVGLGVLATAIQRKVDVFIKPGWVETLSVYILVLIPSGGRKSSVFSHATRCIYEFEKDLRAEMKESVEESQSEYEIMRKRVKHAQDEAAKAKPEELEEKKSIANALAVDFSKMRPLVYRRFVVDDVTPEKVVSILLEQGERIGLLSADTDAFSIIGGRYDKQGQPNLGIFLKAHDGDTHIIDRVTRQGGVLNRPALTMVLTIQPIVFQEMGKVPQLVERGLVARILPAFPQSNVGHREIKVPPVPQHIVDNYDRLILNLFRLKGDTDDHKKPKAWLLRFSPEASDVFDYYASTIEPKLAPYGDYHGFINWASKLVGTVARVAGLLHLGDHHAHPAPWDDLISPETVYRAIEIGDYLAEHARAAHGLLKADSDVELAKYLLGWIKETDKSSVTKRELHRRARGKLPKIDDLESPLNLLIRHGYIRELQSDRKPGAGRNPSPTLEVHPDYLKTYGHNGQNYATQLQSVHSDHSLTGRPESQHLQKGGDD